MANTAIAIATPDLAIIEGQVTTTSQQVAQHFGKVHRDVVRAIDNLECGDEFRLRNFAQSSFDAPMPNGGMRNHKMYRITRDGFTLLAMGFTGKEAMQWKLAYLNAFNQMEAQLLAAQAPAMPATISELQCQHLQELVQLVVQSGKQTHGETWKRFHNKMKVASYRNLPAERFNDAVTYLKGKLDDETMLDLVAKHLAERMPAALEMAMVAASGVFTETVRQVLTAQDSPSMIRLMVGAQHVPGKGLQPMATTIAHDQCVMSFNEMTKAVNEPGGLRLSNADLFGMLGAVTTKLSDRNADQQARLAA